MKSKKVTFQPGTDKGEAIFRKFAKVRDSAPIVAEQSAFVVMNGKRITKLMSARVYQHFNSATVSCLVWVYLNGEVFHGAGRTSGSGYDRHKAALHEALTTAGFTNLYEGGGCDAMMRAAGDAIAAQTPGANRKSLYINDAHA